MSERRGAPRGACGPRLVPSRAPRAPRVRWRTCAAALFALLALAECRPEARPAAAGGLSIRNAVRRSGTSFFFDFGDLPFGERVERSFQLVNSDTQAVKIHDLLPSCGCTVARVSYTTAAGEEVRGGVGGGDVITLPPGTTANLSISVDTTHVEVINRDKLSQVRIRSDSRSTPFITLEMHLLVLRTFRAVPDRIDLGETPQSGGKSARTDVSVEDAKSTARIRGIEKVEGPFDATVDATTIQGVDVWILVVTCKPGLPLGPVNGRVTLSTSRDGGEREGLPFSVPVSAQIARDVVLHPSLFALHADARGEGALARADLVALVPGERIRVLAASARGASAEALSVGFDPVDPDDAGRASSWRIILRTTRSLQDALFSGTVAITLDHPRVPTIEAPYSASLR